MAKSRNGKAAQSGKATWTARRAAAVARVAVQLAREDAGQYLTVHEIARSAADLVAAATEARAALEHGKSPRVHFAAVRNIATAFNAELVDRGDLAGMVVGLKLHSGRFTSGFDNIYFVA